MSKPQSIKSTKALEARFGKSNTSKQEYYDHLDFRCMENFDDDAFAYLMHGVKGVNMLDVNETDIGNESIQLLTRLEYVNELRAKECFNLNNDCAEELNKISSLSFLHLKSTFITIDGLLKLNKLSNLKTLMFTADDEDAIGKKLVELKAMHPQCELVINSKPYYTNAIAVFLQVVKDLPFSYRLKIKNEIPLIGWSNTLTQKASDVLETETQAVYAMDDIEWIEISVIENNEKEKANPAIEPDDN